MNLTETLTLILALAVFGLSGAVVVQYLISWHRTRRMLPLHVWLVTISYNLLVIALVSKSRHEDWLEVIGLAFGVTALIFLQFKKKK